MPCKTCQVCFHAKIKCRTTQGAGRCDRCRRLDKHCFFPERRRNKAPQTRYNTNFSLCLLKNIQQLTKCTLRTREAVRSSLDYENPAPANDSSSITSHDAFTKRLLTPEQGQQLYDVFRSKMMHRFPFVIITHDTIDSLCKEKPSLGLAILAATSPNVKTQQQLGLLFIDLVSERLSSGKFATLDMLQALLVHLAW